MRTALTCRWSNQRSERKEEEARTLMSSLLRNRMTETASLKSTWNDNPCAGGPHQEKTTNQAQKAGKRPFQRALEVAASKEENNEARKSFRDEFWSKTTIRARNTKREEIMKLATMVAGQGNKVFPLTQDTIEGTAAALKAAGLTSADQYLNELKLIHIEFGHEVPPWMTRSLTLCKKALCRDRGPAQKAPERLVEGAMELESQRPKLI